MSRAIQIIPEIRDAIVEAGAQDIFKCYQCGKCFSVCPWYHVLAVEFPVYRIPQATKLGIIASSEDKEVIEAEVKEIFECVGCEACVNECPRGVNITDIIKAIRRIFVEYGTLPQELKAAISKIQGTGNPLGDAREKRDEWCKDLDIGAFQPDMEFLYFPCCIPVYDPRARTVARDTAKILKKCSISFGILGSREECCGESIRRIGAEKLFQKLANTNRTTFNNSGVKQILTTSPHCYTVFKNDYKVIHSTQLFAQLIEEKKLSPQKSLNKRVVYHDPCTLGRQNGIYDEPRKVLSAIPGLELVEVENFNRQYTVCCGGGGGGLWIDLPPEERITNVRIKQLQSTGAEIIAVACPYCLQMFEDAIKVMNLNLEVRDISELLFESL
ncbi:MAG: (Fe-S)-binding protein [bacterium]